MKILYYHQLNKTPVGTIRMFFTKGKIRHVTIGEKRNTSPSEALPLASVFKRASQIKHKAPLKQLLEYFAGERKQFDLNLSPLGTDFQRAVWRETIKIPYGKVKTYKEIAEALGHPGSIRAVGQALGRNPIPIFIPCHRVIAANGIGGYSGGPHIKKRLLSLEMGQRDFV